MPKYRLIALASGSLLWLGFSASARPGADRVKFAKLGLVNSRDHALRTAVERTKHIDPQGTLAAWVLLLTPPREALRPELAAVLDHHPLRKLRSHAATLHLLRSAAHYLADELLHGPHDGVTKRTPQRLSQRRTEHLEQIAQGNATASERAIAVEVLRSYLTRKSKADDAESSSTAAVIPWEEIAPIAGKYIKWLVRDEHLLHAAQSDPAPEDADESSAVTQLQTRLPWHRLPRIDRLTMTDGATSNDLPQVAPYPLEEASAVAWPEQRFMQTSSDADLTQQVARHMEKVNDARELLLGLGELPVPVTVNALLAGHKAIANAFRESASAEAITGLDKAGAVIAAAFEQPKRRDSAVVPIDVLSVGDARGWHASKGKLVRRTADQSVFGNPTYGLGLSGSEEIWAGDEVQHGTSQHAMQINRGKVYLKPGEALLLTSDGIDKLASHGHLDWQAWVGRAVQSLVADITPNSRRSRVAQRLRHIRRGPQLLKDAGQLLADWLDRPMTPQQLVDNLVLSALAHQDDDATAALIWNDKGTIRRAYASKQGFRHRQTGEPNQDTAEQDQKYGASVVLDGMGGLLQGDVAAKLALDAVLELFRKRSEPIGARP